MWIHMKYIWHIWSMWKIRHLSNLESPKSHGPHRNSEELGTAPLPDVHLQQLGQFRLQLQGLIQLTSKVRHVQILQPRRSDGKRGSVSATATGINYRIRIGNDKRNAVVCLELGSCCFSSFQEGGLASSWGQTTRNCQFQLSLKKERNTRHAWCEAGLRPTARCNLASRGWIPRHPQHPWQEQGLPTQSALEKSSRRQHLRTLRAWIAWPNIEHWGRVVAAACSPRGCKTTKTNFCNHQ